MPIKVGELMEVLAKCNPSEDVWIGDQGGGSVLVLSAFAEEQDDEMTREIGRKLEAGKFFASRPVLQLCLNDKTSTPVNPNEFEKKQAAMTYGERFMAYCADRKSMCCSHCNHDKHTGKCGEPLEHHVCSEADICQCLGD